MFWLGGAFSNLGMWALIYGSLWLMHSLTDSPLMLGMVTVSSLGPVLLFSVWGGVVADRVNRLTLVTSTRAAFSGLALLTGGLIITHTISPWNLIAISIGTGILLSFDIPSRQAMLPKLVRREHLLNAMALYSLLFGGSAIIGPSIFAPLVNLWGMEGLFFLIGLAYALTVVMLRRMDSARHRVDSAGLDLWKGLVEGLSYTCNHAAITSLIVIGIIGGLFGMSFETLLPIFADEIFGGSVNTYSGLLLSAGLGGLLATVLIAWQSSLKNSMKFLTLGGIGFGAGLVVFSQVGWLPAALVAMALIGGTSVMFMTVNSTLVQSLVAEEFRGRVMSVHQLAWGSTALGGLLMGFLANTVGAPFALLLGGVVTAAATGIIVRLALRNRIGEIISAPPELAHSEQALDIH